MKKILIVLILIILGHGAHAMYCWEEKNTDKDHTSAMTSKLGASNIVKVSTFLTATYARDVKCYTYTYTYNNNTYYSTKCDSQSIGHNVSTAEYENGVSHGASTITNTMSPGYTYWNSLTSYPFPAVSVGGFSSYKLFDYIKLGGLYGNSSYVNSSLDENKWNYWYGTTNLPYGWTNNQSCYNCDFNYYGKEIRYIEYISPYYTHAYCTTADGGGGGGAAAGAAVNYIIKAD